MPRLAALNARTNRQSQDTPLGCRERATSDMARASELPGMARQRMLDSAAAWTTRAELLERLEAASRAQLPPGPSRGRRKASAHFDADEGADQ